jgi:hypothetical protein
MSFVISATLIIVGVIHLLPLAGVLGARRLEQLYGIAFDEPNLVILMRHRAVLFGLLGAFLVFSAFNPPSQSMAFLAGWISVLSFLVLARSTGGYNHQTARVVKADLIALACLLLGTGLLVFAS